MTSNSERAIAIRDQARERAKKFMRARTYIEINKYCEEARTKYPDSDLTMPRMMLQCRILMDIMLNEKTSDDEKRLSMYHMIVLCVRYIEEVLQPENVQIFDELDKLSDQIDGT